MKQLVIKNERSLAKKIVSGLKQEGCFSLSADLDAAMAQRQYQTDVCVHSASVKSTGVEGQEHAVNMPHRTNLMNRSFLYALLTIHLRSDVTLITNQDDMEE